ncbi:chromate transporter [Pseudomonas sp. MH10]|uniref:chromate transporter n=1 Tax=Pseudomonas sp. MH10 TaxID=3048627 RepID=UPI002AC97063|nr:chromate transporter [Pseudomonas sp. MH10]MEB0039390.1 chromate transporter [Pseudomonas sp. MH10]WPX62333.1 chromate transporter [Pseudomonas sp. MH10]
MQSVLLQLAFNCVLWSLMAIGGNSVAISDIHRYTVMQAHWVTDAQFVAFFAMAQALPGPNGMFLVFIGQEAAGISGALTVMVAKLVPCSMITYYGAAWLERQAHRPWVQRVKRSLLPVTIGLILAASFVLIKSMENGWAQISLTVISAAIIYFSRINAIWLILIGTVLGLTSGLLNADWF